MKPIAALPVLAAVALALSLAACGSDDDAAESPADVAETTTQPTTQPTTAATTDAPAATTAAPADESGDAGGDADGTAITIADFAFEGVTEVAVGDTVVVTNTDGTPHTWTAEDETFDSGAIGPDEAFEFTFTEAGTFSYRCNFHPSMTGEITVTP